MRVIFEGEFFYSHDHDKKMRDHAQDLFLDDLFVDKCIIKGLENETSFVRNAFIKFSSDIVVKMHEIIGPFSKQDNYTKNNSKKLSMHIEKFINKYTVLLK